MKFIGVIIFLLVMMGVSFGEKQKSSSPATAAASAVSKQDYCNPKFGYCFTYDAGIFNNIIVDYNTDGITITDTSGKISAEVYASYNPYQYSVAGLLQENLEYLLRNEPSGPKTINEYQDAWSYIISFETDDAFFRQELVLENNYFKVITIKIPITKSRKEKEAILNSTGFEKNPAMAYHPTAATNAVLISLK